MLLLGTNCEECVHGRVCKHKNNAKTLYNNLCNTVFEQGICDGPSNNMTWDVASNYHNVNIEFRCPDFKKNVDVRRKVDGGICGPHHAC